MIIQKHINEIHISGRVRAIRTAEEDEDYVAELECYGFDGEEYVTLDVFIPNTPKQSRIGVWTLLEVWGVVMPKSFFCDREELHHDLVILAEKFKILAYGDDCKYEELHPAEIYESSTIYD